MAGENPSRGRSGEGDSGNGGGAGGGNDGKADGENGGSEGGRNGGGASDGDASGGGGASGGSGNDGDGPSHAEKAVMAISVAFTLALFAFVVWQAVTTPTGVPPQASVVGTQSMDDGSVRVTVRLLNPSDVGLQLVTVEVGCTTPPPEVQFQNVPADDYQVGYVRCPGGTTNPNASVSWWIEA